MKAVGLIVEYNPFHNGHYYHLHKSKKQSEAEIVIAVMSGYFLQRGEPALVSKWRRTKMALKAGADIVVELPYAFSTGKAEIFANGAVSLLSELKTDEVCFGSEAGNIESFIQTIDFLQTHKKLYDLQTKKFLSDGYSFPKATSLAFRSLDGSQNYLDLSQPNNILGYHYVKAVRDQNSSVRPITLERTGAGYHDEQVGTGAIASATSIRKTILEENKNLSDIEAYIPEATKQQLDKALQEHRVFHSWERLFPYLQHKLLTTSSEELSNIYEAEEGLENRLKQHAKQAVSFNDFMSLIKSKRYTWTRLQRFCTHVLTNTTKQEMAQTVKHPRASYIRLLGMSRNGQTYLSSIKKELQLPLISTISRHQDPLLDLDIRAADCYALGYPAETRAQSLQQEYNTPPIRL